MLPHITIPVLEGEGGHECGMLMAVYKGDKNKTARDFHSPLTHEHGH